MNENHSLYSSSLRPCAVVEQPRLEVRPLSLLACSSTRACQQAAQRPRRCASYTLGHQCCISGRGKRQPLDICPPPRNKLWWALARTIHTCTFCHGAQGLDAPAPSCQTSPMQEAWLYPGTAAASHPQPCEQQDLEFYLLPRLHPSEDK